MNIFSYIWHSIKSFFVYEEKPVVKQSKPRTKTTTKASEPTETTETAKPKTTRTRKPKEETKTTETAKPTEDKPKVTRRRVKKDDSL